MLKRLSAVFALTVSALSIVSAIAPGAPQNFTATVSGNTVTLTWLPPAIGGTPTGYLVEASLSPGGTPLASLPTAASPLVVPSVPNGVYYIRVRGANADGVSQASDEAVVVVPGGLGGASGTSCVAPPNAPQNLTGTAAGNVVTRNWAPPLGGCPASGYAVHAGTAPGLSNVTVANVGAATFLSAGAPAGTYYIRVVALNTFGASVASSETAIAVGSQCQAPTAPPMLMAPSTNGTTVSLNWISPGGNVTGFVVEAGSTSGATNLLNTMTTAAAFTWSNAPSGTHYIRVRALNNCGTGPTSNQVITSVSAPTSPPSSSRVRIGATCRDGWPSTATGSGACSSHGGVSCWKYSDGTCTNP